MWIELLFTDNILNKCDLKNYMKTSYKKGLGFGLTSGVITTLGLIVGLDSSTHSKSLVIGGILIIALADALSDAFGMHISEESQINISERSIWEATLSTFIFKLLFALSFLVPILLFELQKAIIISILWAIMVVSFFSVHLAKEEKIPVWKVVGEHLAIMFVVVILTHLVGLLVSSI